MRRRRYVVERKIRTLEIKVENGKTVEGTTKRNGKGKIRT